MRKFSVRPHSSFSGVSGESFDCSESLLSRRTSSALIGINISTITKKDSNRIDQGQLDGKIKIHSIIKNSDYCTSVNYRSDGRFYAVSLGNGVVNVYSSKTNNILYALNKNDSDLPNTGISATCVRFRPSNVIPKDTETSQTAFSNLRRKKSMGSAEFELEPEPFLPPITNKSLSLQSQQYVQRRRKSSVSALGLRSSEVLGLFSDHASESSPQSLNLVTASFTNGSVKTFNFLTEFCVKEVQENRETLTMAYNRSGNMLATGGSDGRILLYDSETHNLKGTYNPPLDYNPDLLRTYAITFHSQSEDEFIVGGWNKTIQFFDARIPNLITGSVKGPKVTGEGLAFHPSGNEFAAAARDRKRCIETFSYGERRSLGNVIEGIENNSRKLSVQQRKEKPIGSLFYYSVRYLDANFIAFCGSHPGAIEIVNRNSKKGLQVSPSITGLENSVNCIDNFRKKIMFIVQNEVACAEIFE